MDDENVPIILKGQRIWDKCKKTTEFFPKFCEKQHLSSVLECDIQSTERRLRYCCFLFKILKLKRRVISFH